MLWAVSETLRFTLNIICGVILDIPCSVITLVSIGSGCVMFYMFRARGYKVIRTKLVLHRSLSVLNPAINNGELIK